MKLRSFFSRICMMMYGFFSTHQCDASVIPILSSPKDSLHLCNVAIGKVLSAPNKWGLKCTWYPTVSTHGLTYWISIEIQTDSFESMTVQEAEKIYAEVLEGYITEINKIKIIRPLVKEFPITASMFDITMVFRDKNKKDLLPPNITLVSSRNNAEVEFCQKTVQIPGVIKKICTPVSKKPLRTISNKECFFSPSVPRTYDEQKAHIPMYIPYKSEVNAFWKFILDCGHTFCKKHNLIYVIDGEVGENKIAEFPLGYVFCGHQKLSLDDARKLAGDCSRYILQRFQKSKEISAFLQDRNTYSKTDHNGLIAESRHVSFRLSFWDEDINRREAPYIAEVRLLGNSLRYYTSDEGQRLVLVHEESFDDAVKFLEEQEGKPGSKF
jgi:hypothetical protein